MCVLTGMMPRTKVFTSDFALPEAFVIASALQAAREMGVCMRVGWQREGEAERRMPKH